MSIEQNVVESERESEFIEQAAFDENKEKDATSWVHQELTAYIAAGKPISRLKWLVDLPYTDVTTASQQLQDVADLLIDALKSTEKYSVYHAALPAMHSLQRTCDYIREGEDACAYVCRCFCTKSKHMFFPDYTRRCYFSFTDGQRTRFSGQLYDTVRFIRQNYHSALAMRIAVNGLKGYIAELQQREHSFLKVYNKIAKEQGKPLILPF